MSCLITNFKLHYTVLYLKIKILFGKYKIIGIIKLAMFKQFCLIITRLADHAVVLCLKFVVSDDEFTLVPK